MNEPLPPCPFCGNQLIYGDVQRFGVPLVTCSGCPLIIDIVTAHRRTPPPATADLIATLRHHEPQAMYVILVSPEERGEILAEWSAPAAPVLDEHRAPSPGTTGEATCEGLSDD